MSIAFYALYTYVNSRLMQFFSKNICFLIVLVIKAVHLSGLVFCLQP